MMRYFTIALSLLSSTLIAQSTLILNDAFKVALANNFQIKVLENQVEIAENSANIGNAGLLPTVNANASVSANITDTKLEFAGGIAPLDRKGAQSSAQSAGISANYTVFKGLSAQRTYDRLKLNALAVDAQSRSAIEATMLQVANAYYVLARAIDQERIAAENVAVSKIRFQRAALANELGTALRTELLSARVDLTSDSADLLNAQLQRGNAIRTLSKLMATELEASTTTETLELTVKDWSLDQLMQSAKANNAAVKNAALQNELAQKDYQIASSNAFPTLSVSGGYNYNKQLSEAGIVLSNTGLGWNGSVALSYPIFNGFKTKTAMQNQRISMEIRELEKQNQEFQLAMDLQNAWSTYEQSIEIATFEQKNLEAAALNLKRAQEIYNSGQISSTQFREAQIAFASSQVRISNAQISVKLNELELLRLSGQILGNE